MKHKIKLIPLTKNMKKALIISLLILVPVVLLTYYMPFLGLALMLAIWSLGKEPTQMDADLYVAFDSDIEKELESEVGLHDVDGLHLPEVNEDATVQPFPESR